MGSFEAIILTVNHFHADIFLLSKLGLPLLSASFVFNGFAGKANGVVESDSSSKGFSRHLRPCSYSLVYKSA